MGSGESPQVKGVVCMVEVVIGRKVDGEAS